MTEPYRNRSHPLRLISSRCWKVAEQLCSKHECPHLPYVLLMLKQQVSFFDRTTSVMNKFLPTVLFLCLTSATAFAGHQTSDAAVGGGIGGAIGGAIGAEIDGRNGAIIGSGIGAAIGAAVTTEDDKTPAHHHGNTHTALHRRESARVR